MLKVPHFLKKSSWVLWNVGLRSPPFQGHRVLCPYVPSFDRYREGRESFVSFLRRFASSSACLLSSACFLITPWAKAKGEVESGGGVVVNPS